MTSFIQKIKKRYILLLMIVAIPITSYLCWYLQNIKPLNLLIIDKTVLTQKGNEHRSFNWILTHHRYVQEKGMPYIIKDNYMGFFPDQDTKFHIKDLDSYNATQLKSIANGLEMLYLTDTYGIYYNEWYADSLQTEHSKKIYGGLSNNDVELVQFMRNKKKLLIAEFNFFASPTSTSIRKKAEKILNISWSGWTGRYFKTLDTINNDELPLWAIDLYKKTHQNQWPFKLAGILFVNENGEIAILESTKDIKVDCPEILSNTYMQNVYGIPASIFYPYWFDITLPLNDSIQLIAEYKIATTGRGDSILNHHQIPKHFPAAMVNKFDNRFYYFCGDFADNPIQNYTAYFSGIEYIDNMFYNHTKLYDRTKFFWKFYYPMVNSILKNYYTTRPVYFF